MSRADAQEPVEPGHPDWDAFDEGLAAYLSLFTPGEEDTLILDVTAGGVPTETAPYAQFAPQWRSEGVLRAEIVGDAHLAPARPMPEDVAGYLLEDGWSGNDEDSENWYLPVPLKDPHALLHAVRNVTWVLRHGFGVTTPRELQLQAWGPALEGLRTGRLHTSCERKPDAEHQRPLLTLLTPFVRDYLGCPVPVPVACDPARPQLPAPRLVKTAVAAEYYAAEVMESLGFTQVRVTSPGADGGVDVTSREGLAQVKMEGLATGRPVVQAIYGLASLEGKTSLVFSLAGFTQHAREWAERARVALFEFEFDGSVHPRSTYAGELLRDGKG